MKYFQIALIVLLFSASSCDSPNPAKTKENTVKEDKPVYSKKSPEFSADSAYQYVAKQVSFGPRVCNSSAHTNCGDFLKKEFSKYADAIIEQKADVKNWDGRTLHIRNIMAQFNPEAKNRILICSHWDSRPYADNDPLQQNHNTAIDAADDGASGVAVMLEMARNLSKNKINIGVDLLCLDAEDLGKSDLGGDTYCLGSQYWSRHLPKPGYKAKYGILLDMVGGRNARFIWEGYSLKYAESTLRKVWDQAVQLGYANQFFYYQGGYITDDHKYINELAGIPTIDIIHYTEETDTRFPAHWHTVADKLDVIDPQTLKAVGQTLLEVIYKEEN